MLLIIIRVVHDSNNFSWHIIIAKAFLWSLEKCCFESAIYPLVWDVACVFTWYKLCMTYPAYRQFEHRCRY